MTDDDGIPDATNRKAREDLAMLRLAAAVRAQGTEHGNLERQLARAEKLAVPAGITLTSRRAAEDLGSCIDDILVSIDDDGVLPTREAVVQIMTVDLLGDGRPEDLGMPHGRSRDEDVTNWLLARADALLRVSTLR